MDIDPRLRSDAPHSHTAGNVYPQPLSSSGTSFANALPVNTSRLSQTEQYPSSAHDGNYQPMYPPHTPQILGHSDPGAPDSAHGDGTPENGSNDQKRPRACEACRGLKVRCEFDPNKADGPCKRCAKANRNCIVTVPSRKRQKKTDSRVAELEKKIDALTATLQAAKSGTSTHGIETNGDHEGLNSSHSNSYEQVTNGAFTPSRIVGASDWTPQDRYSRQAESDKDLKSEPPPMVIAGQKRKHHESRDSPQQPSILANRSPHVGRSSIATPFVYDAYTESSRPKPTNEYADVIDRGIITMDTATQVFNRFVNEMSPHMPAVVFPPGTTAGEIRKTKPTLFLAILGAGSGTNHPELQRVLTKEVMQIYGDRIICHGEKTLELIQALLVSTIWYWPPEHFEELKFYQLIHLAAVMAIDINIGKKSKVRKTTPVAGLWRDHAWRKTPFPNPETAEARRAWLSCYFLCCNASMGLRRPNLIRWSPYMQDCVEFLETSPEAVPSDKLLVQWVRSQHIAEEVGTQFSMDEPFAKVSISDPKVQYAMKGFERDLQHWSDHISPEIQTPLMKMTEHVLNLYMHEVALHTDHNVEEFKPPFTEENLRGTGNEGGNGLNPLTPSHIAALSTCLTSIDGIFEAFFSLDIETIRTLPVLHFVRIAYAVVVLIKMFFAAATPNSELGKVIDKDNMKVEQYLDGLLDKFRATAANDKSRPASKFLMVLIMLKTWFHRQKAGKILPSKAEVPAETPAQTPGDSAAKHAAHLTSQQHPQLQPTKEFSPANTPLQLLSEVATGNNPQADWNQNQAQQQAFNYQDSSGQGAPGYGSGMASMPYANPNIDPSLGMNSEFDFSMGDGFEQAMGMTFDNAEIGKYFSDDAFFGAVMDYSLGGTGNVFEGLG